jgi:ell wall binding domain 2 (CWB2)
LDSFFPDPSGVGIATSSTFSDALVSAPLLGALDHPLLSVPPTGSLPAALVGYLAQVSGSVGTLVVFGGTAAVSDAVVSEIATALAKGAGLARRLIGDPRRRGSRPSMAGSGPDERWTTQMTERLGARPLAIVASPTPPLRTVSIGVSMNIWLTR